MLPALTYEQFEPFLNSVFQIKYDTHTLELEFAKCEKLKSQAANQVRREPFSLLFLGPPRPVLPQRMYNFDFGELGSLEIFIVPIGPDGSRMRYQAVFS